MKIIGLKIDGLRKLSAAELHFNGNGLTQIKGKNKQGKTSVVDAIEWLISGNRIINKDAINQAKGKAEGELRVGDYLIKRVLTGKSAKLEVKNVVTGQAEKGEVQNFLDTLINKLTFNPRALANLTKVEKWKFCMNLFNIDFSDIDKLIEQYSQDRVLTHRELMKFGEPKEPERATRIDINELLFKKGEIERRNTAARTLYEDAKQKELVEINNFNKIQRDVNLSHKSENDRATNCQQNIVRLSNEIDELKRKLAEKEENLKSAELQYENIIEIISMLPQALPEKPLIATIQVPNYESTAELDEQIQNSLAINQKADAHDAWARKLEEKNTKLAEYEVLDSRVKELQAKKVTILQGIDTKVEGLIIGEDDIYYKGIGSENWSDSERLIITSELCLAMMPELRTMFIDGMESMDHDSMEELHNWAVKNDVQIIGTIVTPSIPDVLEDGVFYIQEGKVLQVDSSYEVVED